MGSRSAGALAPDGDDLAHYLRTAHALESIAAGKRARDRLLGLQAGQHVLDVGCGLGEDAARLAQLVGPGGRVVGFDVSRALLDRARAAYPALEWVAGDAHQLPFDEASFDAARTERTLQHVRDPRGVLAEMRRVVRPGGVVMACEPDWATIALSARDQATVDAFRVAAESAIGHPRMGRALPALFADVGLVAVDVAAEAVAVRDFRALQTLGDLSAVAAVAAADGLAPRAALDALLSGLERDAGDGRLLATLTLVTVWGRV